MEHPYRYLNADSKGEQLEANAGFALILMLVVVFSIKIAIVTGPYCSPFNLKVFYS